MPAQGQHSKHPKAVEIGKCGSLSLAQGIGYTMADNAFVRTDDWGHAQQLADALSPDQLHRALDRYATLCCPVSEVFGLTVIALATRRRKVRAGLTIIVGVTLSPVAIGNPARHASWATLDSA